MSYIDDLEQAAAEALAASSSATSSAQIMADVANGDENTTVTTANGEVKTLAKAIKDIIDSIEVGVEAPQVEPQTLSAGQTTVSLTTMTTEGIAVYVEGSREFDFTVVSSTDFDFGQSFPDGTRIWVVKRDIEGVADSFTVNTSTGSQTLSNALDQRVIYVDTIADLQALPTSGLVDGQEAVVSGSGLKWSASSSSWKKNGHLDVRAYGAKVDGLTIDTAAIQAMVDDVGYFRLPSGTSVIDAPILVPAGGPYGTLWKGDGMEQSILECSGMAGFSAIKAADSASLYRVTMRDFRIQGDCDTCIDFSGTDQLFQSEFRNLVLRSKAGSAFIATEHFSTSWYNVHASSEGGHGFEIEGGNSTVLINCYAHDFTVGNGKAGYRIRGTAVLIACNGLDSGDVWGDFGATTANDGFDSQFRITMVGGNMEDFDKRAIRLRFTGVFTMKGATFVAKSSGTFETLIDGSGVSGHYLEMLGNTFSTKGSTISLSSRIITGGRPKAVLADETFPDIFANGDSILYTTNPIKIETAEFGVWATTIDNINYNRSYGFNSQFVRTWTPDSSSYDVSGETKINTANTVATNLDNATGGVEGQSLYITVEDSNTTIRHLIGGVGRFNNKSGADIATSPDDVYHYIYNGTQWNQV